MSTGPLFDRSVRGLPPDPRSALYVRILILAASKSCYDTATVKLKRRPVLRQLRPRSSHPKTAPPQLVDPQKNTRRGANDVRDGLLPTNTRNSLFAPTRLKYLSQHRKERELSSSFLTDEEIRNFSRDLRILLATNGTLTRILGVLANDEIVTQVIDQDIHPAAPDAGKPEDLFEGRLLRRRALLKGASSNTIFVVAESFIAIDLVPSKLAANLIEMDGPIGESILANSIEIFKETPKVWMDTLPHWLAADEYQDTGRAAVARQYRVTIRSKPAIVITEYFPQSVFADTVAAAKNATDGGDKDTVVSDFSGDEAMRQHMADC
ncbi:chorismate--pyruvate lyase family protein [Mycobacterium sp. ML4]